MSELNGLDTNELMKRMKAIASDLWGGVPAEGEKPSAEELPADETEVKPVREEDRIGIRNLWKTADETIDWTDALAHGTPTDGLTGPRLWSFYHKHADKVLSGDLDAYTEVLQKANPLGELTDYADNISMRVVSADRLESTFRCRPEQMEKNRQLYLSAMGLRIARDLLACLPVEEVTVKAEYDGEEVFSVIYPRQKLLHRNFAFLDPVAFSEECGAVFG